MGRRGTGKGAQRGMMAPIRGGERGKELAAGRKRRRGEEEGIAEEDDE